MNPNKKLISLYEELARVLEIHDASLEIKNIRVFLGGSCYDEGEHELWTSNTLLGDASKLRFIERKLNSKN